MGAPSLSSILVAMPRRRIFVSNVCLGRRLRVMPLGCLKDSLVQHSQVHLSPLHDSAIGGKRRFSGGGRSGTLAAADSDKAPQLLHYEWLHPKASVAPVLPVTTLTSSPSSHHHQHIVTVVLHGLLGNVRNIKTLATRLCELPLQSQSQPSGAAIVATTTRASLVMDLTGHGRSSKNMSDSSNNNNNNSTADARSSSGSSTAVTSVADVARDVAWTLRQALRDPKGHPMFATPGGSPTIPLTASSTSGSSSSTLRINWVGHSLGGRVALYHAVAQVQNDLIDVKEPIPTMSNLWLLDTVPHAIDASVQHTLSVARDIVTQQLNFASSKDFVEHLQQHADYRLSSTTAQWLATQYDLKQRHFAFDVGVAESLARDIPQHDFWNQVDRIVEINDSEDGSPPRPAVHLIVGAKNTSWTADELERVNAYSRRHEANHCFTHHILRQAGHWVHIDHLPGILKAVQSVEERPHGFV